MFLLRQYVKLHVRSIQQSVVVSGGGDGGGGGGGDGVLYNERARKIILLWEVIYLTNIQFNLVCHKEDAVNVYRHI